MKPDPHAISRRALLAGAGCGAVGAVATSLTGTASADAPAAASAPAGRGGQRLTIEQLEKWESLRYGMFISFGLSTFLESEYPDGKAPAARYAPDRLDVDQWISVARDAGMKYAVLTAKHVAGHCLWPSRVTEYTVARSGNRTDVVEHYVKACEKRGVKAGLYYCSWDNRNRFGSRTPSDPDSAVIIERPNFNYLADGLPAYDKKGKTYRYAFTTSLYQDYDTDQITELLTQYGPIVEVWLDIPGLFGRGYRAFLYRRIAEMQPETVVLTNSGMNSGEPFRVDYAWPCDVVAIEIKMPPEAGHKKWRTVEGKECYLPGECSQTIGSGWFHSPGHVPKPDKELADLYTAVRNRGMNLLLNVPPDRSGRILDDCVQAVARLRKNVGL